MNQKDIQSLKDYLKISWKISTMIEHHQNKTADWTEAEIIWMQINIAVKDYWKFMRRMITKIREYPLAI
jgi:hypothetical protein